MALRLTIIAMLAGVVAMAANASADGDTYPTADEAGIAALIVIGGEGTTFIGRCDETRPEPLTFDACYDVTNHGSYATYIAVKGLPDFPGWWAGVKPVGDGRTPYDGGTCGNFYCRMTDPAGSVTFSRPNGDANEDGEANSLDALLVLQHVAGAIDLESHPMFAMPGDVDHVGGITGTDALLILQSDARLIQGLPVRLGEPPFGDK